MNLSFLNIEYFFALIYRLLTEEGSPRVPEEFFVYWSRVEILSTVLSLLFLVGIAYSLIRVRQIRSEELLAYASFAPPRTGQERTNERWERVLAHAASENPNDWRHSILEADIMLDDLLNTLGYLGEGIGEKLKNADPAFRALNEAWEAHKVRNQIAHEGADFILTRRETRRVLDLYQQVFEASGYL